jgi:glycosyltransferase involved in cell wall biosynthesis
MTENLRVLFVNRMAATERGGGETFDLEISRHLTRLGCEVTFLSNIPLLGKAKLSVPNPVYIRSPHLPWFPWDKVKGGWRIRVWEFQQFENKAAKWISKNAGKYDIIQICELPYLVSLLKTKYEIPHAKIVVRLTAPNAHDPWGGIKLADAVIASGTSINKVRKKLRPDVHDVPNAVDLQRFQAEREMVEVIKFRSAHHIPDDAPLFLYVARFQDFKKHDLLINAFERVADAVPDARLVLAGSGPLQTEVEKLIKARNLGGRVTVLGEVKFDDLPDVYAAANIKVISSEYESFCFAAIEAMASGKPIITTDCGWVPKLIGDVLLPIEKQWASGGDAPGRFDVEEDGRRIRTVPGGLVVSRVECISLANAMIQMVHDKKMQSECGKWNNLKAIREHGWESSARTLLSIYEGLKSGK